MDETLSQSISLALLDGWISAGRAEGHSLDAKITIPGCPSPLGDNYSKKEACREFAADVAAFANADGGVLLFGVSEEEGVLAKKYPQQFDRDKEELRLRSIISELDPPLPAVFFDWIPDQDGLLLALRVPASYRAPHQVIKRGFVIRRGNRNEPMRRIELQDALARNTGVEERAREFVDQRTRPSSANPQSFFLFSIPISAFADGRTYDLRDIAQRPTSYLLPDDTLPRLHRWNHHGYLVAVTHRHQRYMQFHRTGAIEFADHGVVANWRSRAMSGQPASGKQFNHILRSSARRIHECQSSLEVGGPFLWTLVLDGVFGVRFEDERTAGDQHKILEPRLDLPFAFVESGQSPEDAVTELSNRVWQAAGQPRSPYSPNNCS